MSKKPVEKRFPVDVSKLRKLGAEAYKARTAAKKSAREIAEIAGCSTSNILHFEYAYNWLSMPVYLRVRDALGMEKLT